MKRVLQALIVTLLVLLVPLAAQAKTLTSEQLESIQELFLDIETGGENAPINGANRDGLGIGEAIPVWRHLADGSVEYANEFYPVMSDGKMIALLLKDMDEQNDTKFWFQTGFSAEMTELIDENGITDLAVFCDAKGMQATDGRSVVMLNSAENESEAEDDERLSTEPFTAEELLALGKGDVSNVTPVNLGGHGPSDHVSLRWVPVQHALRVPAPRNGALLGGLSVHAVWLPCRGRVLSACGNWAILPHHGLSPWYSIRRKWASRRILGCTHHEVLPQHG